VNLNGVSLSPDLRLSQAKWLFRNRQSHTLARMNLKDGSTIVADLTTIGRKTGLPRTVELRFVYHQGCFYASSSKVQGKHWCQNMIKNSVVEIKARGKRFSCRASQVTDEKLRRYILELRDSPPRMDRVVFEMKPNG